MTDFIFLLFLHLYTLIQFYSEFLFIFSLKHLYTLLFIFKVCIIYCTRSYLFKCIKHWNKHSCVDSVVGRLGSPAHSAGDLSSPCTRVWRRAIHLFLLLIRFCGSQSPSRLLPLARREATASSQSRTESVEMGPLITPLVLKKMTAAFPDQPTTSSTNELGLAIARLICHLITCSQVTPTVGSECTFIHGGEHCIICLGYYMSSPTQVHD